MRFRGVREYYPGDDVRFIDWNVSARFRILSPGIRGRKRAYVILLVDVAQALYLTIAQHKKGSYYRGGARLLLAPL